jgi:hypothetical protein
VIGEDAKIPPLQRLIGMPKMEIGIGAIFAFRIFFLKDIFVEES